jgi:hypothetical protein
VFFREPSGHLMRARAANSASGLPVLRSRLWHVLCVAASLIISTEEQSSASDKLSLARANDARMHNARDMVGAIYFLVFLAMLGLIGGTALTFAWYWAWPYKQSSRAGACRTPRNVAHAMHRATNCVGTRQLEVYCGAIRCTALQRGVCATCNAPCCVATHLIALQRAVMRCNALCCAATRCAALERGVCAALQQGVGTCSSGSAPSSSGS